MGKKLILMTGCSGSGKSTLAQELYIASNCGYAKDSVIFSTDNFHMRFIGDKWQYVFQPDQLGFYHKENQAAVFSAMGRKQPLVIVDNTNLTFEECKPYVIGAYLYGYEVEFKEPETSWSNNAGELASRNAHGVPIDAIKRMLSRKQPVSTLQTKTVELMAYLKGVK